MQRPDWAPEGVDLERPSAARVYDYFLGGAHNFAADRQLADQIASMTPNIADTMRANRHFLRRVVRYLVAQGISQFVDIGSGIPTVGNVHEVAQQANPAAKIVYVDVDPVAVAHSLRILEGNERTTVVQADVRDGASILQTDEVRRLIDLSQPVATLLAGVLHFIPDSDDPAGIVAQLRDALPSGSYIVISHVTWEDQPREVIEAQKLSTRTATEIVLRSKAEIAAMFDGCTLVEPGLVHLPLWRPDGGASVDHPERYGAFGGVGRIP